MKRVRKSRLPIYANEILHVGPRGYGLLSVVVALGSLTGALISARRPRSRLRTLLGFGSLLAALNMVAAAMPNQLSFAVLLFGVGISTLLLLTSANSTVQIAAPDSLRGRVMGLYLLVLIGGAAIGGPLIGAADEHLGPRVGMLIAGALPDLGVGLIAARRVGFSGGLHQLRASAPAVIRVRTAGSSV